MNMFRKNRKGFTLIELIVVIAILAILAAIAIPTFVGITDSANNTVNQANASNIATAYNAYQALNPNDQIGLEKASFAGATDLDQVNALKAAIGPELWPRGLDDLEAQGAWPWLLISGGVADVVPISSPPVTSVAPSVEPSV